MLIAICALIFVTLGFVVYFLFKLPRNMANRKRPEKKPRTPKSDKKEPKEKEVKITEPKPVKAPKKEEKIKEELPKLPAESIRKSEPKKELVSLAVNYSISFVKSYIGELYYFINISLINNHTEDVDDLTISFDPDAVLLNDMVFGSESNEGGHTEYFPEYYDTVGPQLSLHAKSVVTGYVILAARDEECPIDEIHLFGGEVDTLVKISKQRIMRKNAGTRKF